MEMYLSGESPSDFINADELYVVEERTMVRKNRSKRRVEDGGLYTVEYLRFRENVGLLIELHGTSSMPQSGIMRLGGDNRAVYFRTAAWKDPSPDAARKQVAKNARFKIALVTPAIFHNGWLPGSIDPRTGEGNLKGVKVKLKGACIGRPTGIGGFDIVKNMPKVMKRAAPAGSVYFFEVGEIDADAVFDTFWFKSISDERGQEGFGSALIGGY